MSLFETRDLTMSFARSAREVVRALDAVSLQIEERSFTVLRGPSGSGKTTLLALLGALERPTKGLVSFRDRDLGRLSDVELSRVRRQMGFVFQDFSLIAGLPVWENISYPLIPRGVGRAERYERALDLLARMGLADRMMARPSELSGGEQQRVAVARALVGKPDVILADEPTSNLDPEASATLLALLREIHGEGKTIILSSHEPEVALMATQVFVLERGRLKKEDLPGSSAELG